MFKDFAPYHEKLLGGLLCFNVPIEENPDGYFPPANANLIGCGVYETLNNTKNTYRGNYNQVESEFNKKDRYVKYVYDFATNQANGTISSICLTHKHGGFTSYGGKNTERQDDFPLLEHLCDDTLQYIHPDCTRALTGSRYTGVSAGTTEALFLIDKEAD